MKTPFEQALEAARAGKLQTPTVSTTKGNIDYFGYQLAVHHFNLKLMAKGLSFRGITFTQLKKYYGLKGRSAKECLPQFEKIYNDYKLTLNPGMNGAKRRGLRAIKVWLSDGTNYTTSMAAHLTDRQMLDYFAVGTWLNVGTGGRDKMVQVIRRKIIN